MTHSDNKTHGGKGLKAPTASASKKYWDNYDAIDWSTGKGDSKVAIDESVESTDKRLKSND